MFKVWNHPLKPVNKLIYILLTQFFLLTYNFIITLVNLAILIHVLLNEKLSNFFVYNINSTQKLNSQRKLLKNCFSLLTYLFSSVRDPNIKINDQSVFLTNSKEQVLNYSNNFLNYKKNFDYDAGVFKCLCSMNLCSLLNI